ncbi:cysteine and histidine-rich domain-containing protein 1-like [Dendronephthya gigantea]|uniref:cysteine and histidine-rich domain-containing protein 1-like n=1 Tax=Dendronephthya gigantea TaxID=151771 RepID=UPI00106C3370|nr:cysteine and histidine-rich domain-containing protein 1-like [Dendronephthya gigantea]
MSAEEKLLCYNRGCGKQFLESENNDDVCTHHPGMPVFHDALKGWSCCQRRVTDFTEFLNIAGCRKSKHSNVKPPEPEVKPKNAAADIPIASHGQTTHRKAEEKIQEIRPSDDLPYQKLKFSVSDSLKKALERHIESITNNDENVESGVVQKGTTCKNNACNEVYVDENTNGKTCKYHTGSPIFHEGYKFWSCCMRKTSDFDEFLKQEGCSSGNHVWFLTDEQKKKAVMCRFDHYQMGMTVVISIYAKLCDPAKSFVEANCTCLKACFVFGNSSKFDLDIKLHGVIDPIKSSVIYSATKVEIKLKKSQASNWPRLELNS